jgi:hypothetical protein
MARATARWSRRRRPSARQAQPEAANAARGAAAVMAMNNVYYRFVHLASNPEYATLPAKLRMNFIASHGIDKDDFDCSACRERDERLRHVHRQP